MSKFSLENFPSPFSGGDDQFDFDPLGLFREASQFRPPSLRSIEPSSIDFGAPIERLMSFDAPNPQEIFGMNFGDIGMSGRFGDTFGGLSNLLSSPSKLFDHGLFGVQDDLGGIMGDIFSPVKNAFGLGDMGGLSSRFGGILGGAMDFLGPAGGIIGGLLGRDGGLKGMLSGAAKGLLWSVPVVGPFLGVASMFGLDKLAGKALGGIGDAIGGLAKGIGGGIKKLFGGLF